MSERCVIPVPDKTCRHCQATPASDWCNLCAIHATKKTGDEPFHSDGEKLNGQLIGFWKWAYSDLVNNVARGVLAEFLVANALGITKDITKVRTEWEPYDLKSKKGTKIEVKNSAYIQSWEQEKPSQIQFNIRRKKKWIEETGKMSGTPQRHSDVYVFCVLAEKEAKIDPMNISQWEFYVVSTSKIDKRLKNQKTITLGSLKSNFSVEPIPYDKLAEQVEQVKRRGASKLS